MRLGKISKHNNKEKEKTMNDIDAVNYYVNKAIKLLDSIPLYESAEVTEPVKQARFANATAAMPKVKRAVFSNDVTVVYFEDGTYTVVKKNPDDEYNRELAIVYAIVKRAYGKVDPYSGKVKGGVQIGDMLNKIIADGVDQVATTKAKKENKTAETKQDFVKPWKKSSANEEADKVNSPNCRNCKFPTCSECLGAKDYRSSATWSDNSKWDWNKVQNRDSKGRFAKKSNRK